MITLKDYIKDKKASRISEALKKRQFREVKFYMKKIYNPPYYLTKPKFRKAMSLNELKIFNKALKAVYNPKTTSKNDVFKYLGIRRMAST